MEERAPYIRRCGCYYWLCSLFKLDEHCVVFDLVLILQYIMCGEVLYIVRP
jgi:hypothetical protein